MDNILTIILILNVMLSLYSIIKERHSKVTKEKSIVEKNNKYIENLLAIDEKINSPNYKRIFRNYCYDIKTKCYDEVILKKQENLYSIFLFMKYSSEYFSDIYKDNDILCNIRIKDEDYFKTIAEYYTNEKSKCIDKKTEVQYSIKANTDLLNIYTNNYNKFIIANISDYKKKHTFFLENKQIEEYYKAIITITIFDDVEESQLIGCYTLYFSKPIDERIEFRKISIAINALTSKLRDLIIEYLSLNPHSRKKEKDDNVIEIITNKSLSTKMD